MSTTTHMTDSAYGSGELRAELVTRGHVDLVNPAPNRSAFPGGFTVDDFVVDHINRVATCPAGVTRHIGPAAAAAKKATTPARTKIVDTTPSQPLASNTTPPIQPKTLEPA